MRKNHEDLQREYKKLSSLYHRLVEEIEFIIRKRLSETNLKIAAILSRVKTIESIIGKTERKAYDDPLKEISDIAGVRVVCLYESDLPSVAAIIKRAFHVVESLDKKDSLGFDRMGYQDQHHIVQLGSQYNGARYDDLQELRCEIQIRTILQDAWSQISHHLAYKSEASIPQHLRRDLNNVMSLLEIAQSVFDRVADLRQQYVGEVDAKKTEGEVNFLAQPIDHETLAAYTTWKYPNLSVKYDLQEILLADLDLTRFKTLRDVDQVVRATEDAVQEYRREQPNLFKFGTDFITKSLGFGDKAFREKHRFSRQTREAFMRYANKVKSLTDQAIAQQSAPPDAAEPRR